MKQLTFIAAMGLLFACGDKDNETEPSSEASSEPSGEASSEPSGEPSSEANAENGAIVFGQRCAGCHGTDGGGASAPSLIGSSLSDSEIADIIENGVGSMPGGLASGSDIDDIIAYLRTL